MLDERRIAIMFGRKNKKQSSAKGSRMGTTVESNLDVSKKNSAPAPNKKKKLVIVGAVVLVVVAVVGGWFIFRNNRDNNAAKAGAVCGQGGSNPVAQESSPFFAENKAEQLKPIVDKILTFKDYDKDPNCLA